VLAILLAMALQNSADTTVADVTAIGPLMDRWKICTAAQARLFALGSREPAETVADAAIGACHDELIAVKTRMTRAGGGELFKPAEVDDMISRLRSEWRPQLLANVLRTRMAPKK
jgi:hypothetical protein